MQGLKATEDVTGVGSTGFESEVGRIEILLQYEQAKTLQGELGDQLHRLCDIFKHFEHFEELVTKHSKYQRRHTFTSLVGNGVQLAGFIAQFFTILLGLPLLLLGTVIYAVEECHDLCSANKTEPQLFIEHQQTVGRFQEALCVFKNKYESFMQHLDDIAKLCIKYPNELVVLKECGQVSTQVILKDISIHKSRVNDFLSSVANSYGTYKGRILDEEEAMSSIREDGVKEDYSALKESEKMMKLTRLITAPIILTTRMMIQ